LAGQESPVLSEGKPKNFNEVFLEKVNLDSINLSLEIYENPLKGDFKV
jgi:hypothetical protein